MNLNATSHHKKLNKLSSTSSSSPEPTDRRICRSPPSPEPLEHNKIKIISNILLRKQGVDSDCNFIIERNDFGEDTPNEHYEVRKDLTPPSNNHNNIEENSTVETFNRQRQTNQFVNNITESPPGPCHKENYAFEEDCHSGAEEKDELKSLFKYSYHMFEKLLRPDASQQEMRAVLKHSYFMFTSMLFESAEASEGYKDLLEICDILKKYRD